jgi:hypothetical protein
MADEEIQELGREGVGKVKAWLEATTWMRLPYNAYEDGPRCKVVHASGAKKFDLRGHFLGDKASRRELTIECKKYSSAGIQSKEFKRFIAIAYGATKKQIAEKGEWREDFMWVTFHPFLVTDWSTLTNYANVLEVLRDPDHREFVGEEDIDEEVARSVADSVWLLVLNEKQLEVALTPEELAQVHTVLKREGNPLWSN